MPAIFLRRTGWLGLAGFLTVGSGGAFSAEEPVPAASSQRLNEIVVSPTRTPVPASESGSTLTGFSGPDIESHNTSWLSDLLNFAPGVAVRRSGGPGGQTSIFTRGTNSNHTKVLLDGIDVADPSSPNNIPPTEFLTSGGTGSMEFLRGPQSALYGSDAIGGVLSIETPQGAGDPSHAYTQWLGSFHTHSEQVTAQAGGEKYNYFVNFSFLETDSISNRTSNNENDPYRNASLRSRYGWNFTDQLAVDVFYHFIEAENEFDGFGNIETDQTDSTRHFFKLRPRYTSEDGRVISTLNVSYTDQDRDTDEGFFSGAFQGRLFEIDWQNDWQADDRQLFTLGLVHRQETGEGTSPLSTFDEEREASGVYLQDQIRISETVFITPGFRTESYSRFGTQTTWRVAGAIQDEPGGRVWRSSVGTGFKAPSLDQLFSTSIFGGGGNADLNPEESQGFDVGVEQDLGADRVFGATFFYNDIENLIAAEDTGGFVFVNFNIESALIRGCETFLRVPLSEQVDLQANYTYTDTRAGDLVQFSALAGNPGGRLLRRPLHQAGAHLLWKLPGGKAEAVLEGIYVSERDDAGSTVADDYVLANLAVTVQAGESVTLMARIENLGDAEYVDVVGFETAGLSGYAGVKIGF